MAYVINKGEYYCRLTETNAIKKTKDLELATKFNDSDKASKIIFKATNKLKDYKVVDLDTNQTVKYIAKCKRKNFTATQRMSVYNNDKGTCGICGKFVSVADFTLDHIIPIAKGGTNDLENLQCAHKVCNQIKQDILPDDLMDKLSEIMVYQMEKNYNEQFYKKIRYIRKQKKGGVLSCIFG